MMRPALLLMVGRAIGFAATFFVPVVLVRLLDQGQFGTYKQLFLVFGTLFPLAQMGMAESLYYFLPTGERKLGRYLANALLALALSGGIAMAALIAGSSQVAAWLNNPALAENLPLVGLYLLLSLVSAVLEIVLTARERYGAAATSYAASDVARALLLIVPALAFGTIRWLMIGAVAFAAIRLVATLVYLHTRMGITLRPGRGALREQVSYSAPFQMSVIFETLESNAHFYAVAWFFDAATYAVYAVGCLQIPLVGFIGSSVGNVLMVKLRAAAAAGDEARVLHLWKETTRRLALVFFPLTALLLLGAHDLITLLFTADYAAAVPVFMIWTTFILMSVADTDAVLRVYAETRFLAGVNALCLAITLALVGAGIALFGLPGAVLATLVATLTGEVLAIRRFGKILGVPVRDLLPWGRLARIGGIGAAASVPAVIVQWVGPANPLLSLPLMGCTYTLVYVGLVMVTGVLSDDERRTLLVPLGGAGAPFLPDLQPVAKD